VNSTTFSFHERIYIKNLHLQVVISFYHPFILRLFLTPHTTRDKSFRWYKKLINCITGYISDHYLGTAFLGIGVELNKPAIAKLMTPGKTSTVVTK